MEEKLIGTHDSMSFLSPKNPLMYLGGLLVARCQSKNLEEQAKAGAQVFDLRVYYDKKGKMVKCKTKSFNHIIDHWRFAHGACKFRGMTLFEALEQLMEILENSSHQRFYIRVIYERGEHQLDFIEMCKLIEKIYHEETGGKFVFFGGNQKSDWKQLYKFNNIYCKEYANEYGGFSDLYNNQWVSSMAEDARWYEKAIPYLYAKRMNEKNLTKTKFLTNLYDFL